MLTQEHIAALERRFQPAEHKFFNGNPYLTKSAIRRRLTEVDPGWQITAPELVFEGGGIVTMRAGLTICGVTRYAIGAAAVQIVKPDDKGEINHYMEELNLVRAFKYADADLLPRCAQRFGIGAYLKDDMPKNIRDIDALTRWLNGSAPAGQQTGQQGGQPPRQTPPPAPAPATQSSPAGQSQAQPQNRAQQPPQRAAGGSMLSGGQQFRQSPSSGLGAPLAEGNRQRWPAPPGAKGGQS